MLDALLDLSKLDAGLVMAQPQRVRIALPVQAVMASFRAAATARGLDLRCDCPNDIEVVSDPELMRRMLANVVDNAIKFTDAGAVTVQVTAEDRDVQIAVRDTGPGIAPEHHGLIFEDTVQLRGDGGDRPPGHGLGLGIVRRTAALLKVDVIVDSAPGRGSVFHWRMPRAAASAVAVPPVHVETRLQGRQVLILDDDAMVRGAYANALSSAGAQMHTAATIAEAIGPAELADAVVVDWRLRDNETAFMAIERLRQRRPRLPMVMVTADTGAEIAEAAKQAGVAALLRKPVDAAELARALANAIVEAKPD